MPSAIVIGATGILGREIVLELGRNPQQWPTVHALSRSKKQEIPENTIHNHIDLTSDAKDMAKDLKSVIGEYVFFAAYLQKDSEQENWDVNGDMLENFLKAVELNDQHKNIKRIILVTGAKQYGVHLGQPKNPMLESDPWLRASDHPPNFYYRQQDILKQYAAKHKSWDWVVTYPNDVIGFAVGNYMNLATALGLYAAVSKELDGALVFPGSETFYLGFDNFTTASLHGRFCAWAALEPRAGNEAFNVVNGDTESWQNLWPRVARRFGCEVPPDQFARDAKFEDEMDMHARPPIDEVAGEIGVKGRVKPSKVESKVGLTKWAQDEKVKEAWQRLAQREGLDEKAWEGATWGFLSFVLGRNFSLVQSMSKARKLGWTGYKDTWESLEEVFDELEKVGILPKSR